MWKLTPALMAASALHVAGLAALVGTHGGHADVAAGQARPQALAWQARVLPAPARAPAALPGPTFSPAPAEAPTGVPETQPDQAPQVQATSQATAAPEGLPDPYWPRPQLSRPPVPRTVVAIDFPEGEPTPGRHTAVLALYIDEAGQVQRVDTSDAQLPGPYIEAARNAFLLTRFEPGEIGGRAVKSLIHIEVQFNQAEAQLAAAPTRLSRSFAGLP